ncbi:MAG TPA: sn-glycerol-3-phosphate ABC transporter ATP-binding protein UgpC [Pseudolabrys sp.]|nr:sn-glycerol-3-phosphate ABC transporter ATP-binding protein UgpC [Pseudolabrys sp.]
MTVTVSLRQVRKAFGAAEVIHGIDLDIAPGEFVVLVGPSGCGKSTLLRMIAGLESVSSGEIAIDGLVVNDIDPADRDIAMVFQSYALYPHMTVRENLAFSLDARGLSRAAKTEKIGQVALVLGLETLLNRYPRQLSGGQRQRVAMGRAMVRDPRVFLFDEPLSNLDAKLRAQMRLELKALHKRLRNTAVYVTHDQVEAMTMADRVVLMRDGRIEQIGKPLELYDRPASAFVAQFIGLPAMNMVHGRAMPRNGGYELETAEGLRLPLPADAAVNEGQPIIVGLRPEHLTIADDGLPCNIELTEPLGREILVYGTMGNSPICIAPGGRPAIDAGCKVGLRYDVQIACVFDAASERSLRHGH